MIHTPGASFEPTNPKHKQQKSNEYGFTLD